MSGWLPPLEIASSHPVQVDKAAASDWLPHAMTPAEPEMLTVVWHSITQMYWDADELAAVEAIMHSVGARQLLGEVGLEFDLNDPDGSQPEVGYPTMEPPCRYPASAIDRDRALSRHSRHPRSSLGSTS